MHRTCTNNPVKSDRRNWLIHREVQFEVCFLRPCSEEGSDATKPIKNNSRLRQQCRTSKLKIRRRGGSWVEPLPIAENWQVRMADQAMYHQGNQSVFVGGRLWTLLPPPAYMSRKVLKNTKQTEGSFTSVQMVHTHASLPRGFFSDPQAVKAIIRSLKRKWLQNTGKNHLLN